jgi:hypothetical protein
MFLLLAIISRDNDESKATAVFKIKKYFEVYNYNVIP